MTEPGSSDWRRGPSGLGPPRRLATTEPFDGATLFAFLRRFAVPGVEAHDRGATAPLGLTRTLRLAHGPAVVRLTWDGAVLGLAYAGDPADEADAVARVRRLVDADAPVDAVAAVARARTRTWPTTWRAARACGCPGRPTWPRPRSRRWSASRSRWRRPRAARPS